MKDRTKKRLFKLPAEIVLIAAFIASLFVKISGSYPLNWSTVIFLLIINVLYIYAEYFRKSNLFEI